MAEAGAMRAKIMRGDRQEDVIDELSTLLDGLKTDADAYFSRSEEFAPDEKNDDWRWSENRVRGRDEYWVLLPNELHDEAKRLDHRLVSLMGHIALAVRKAPLASEADQRDVMTGTKAMRAALLLREFRSWNADVLNDEDIILAVTPAGQSDDSSARPEAASHAFSEWMGKIGSILDLVAASHELESLGSQATTEATRYRPGTAFIMMWMDKAQPDLVDVSDAVKEIFGQFRIRAVRADDIEHEGLITSRILTEIKTAEFCFADLTGGRPNVYYEVGYAHALGRRVILFRKAGTGLHFDLANYNCPEYNNLRDLKTS
jgi:hypothetical protein